MLFTTETGMKPRKLRWLAILLWIVTFGSVQSGPSVWAQAPIFRAVLFYSPTCGHCHYVITEVLPPLLEQYGEQLQIVGVNIANFEGQTLYQSAVEHFAIPNERRGVPTLIVADILLVGSGEIPEQLPSLIEHYLAIGGVDWPDIPGLAEVVQAAEATPEATAEATAETTSNLQPGGPAQPSTNLIDSKSRTALANDFISRFQQDAAGNSLSVLLLIGMLAVIGFVLRRLWRVWQTGTTRLSLARDLNGWRTWAIAVLGLIGLGVSIYMAYVETTHTLAVCGPIGDCNTVQQSPYALLFGLIPIGLLGIVGYAAMLIVWLVWHWGSARFRNLAESTLFGMALFGTIFSMYLTFLEPFVIGATCVWCLTSAISMTLTLFVLAGSVSAYPAPAIQQAPT